MVKYKPLRHKPPSRIRYEQNHPTISFRLDLETKNRLKNALEGRSFASFIKEALGVKEREIKSIEDAYNKGYKDGSEKGYAKARKDFEVSYNCVICGETIIIKTKEAKEAINKYMQEHGWGHISCHEEAERRRRRQSYY